MCACGLFTLSLSRSIIAISCVLCFYFQSVVPSSALNHSVWHHNVELKNIYIYFNALSQFCSHFVGVFSLTHSYCFSISQHCVVRVILHVFLYYSVTRTRFSAFSLSFFVHHYHHQLNHVRGKILNMKLLQLANNTLIFAVCYIIVISHVFILIDFLSLSACWITSPPALFGGKYFISLNSLRSVCICVFI